MAKRVYLSPPHMGPRERELLLDAYDSNWIAPLGPHVDAFEREICERLGVAHAVALSSGTAALHLALLLLGVGPEDEVITSSLTFAASAHAIAYTGAAPVFIDSDTGTWNMDPALLEEELETASRAGRLPKAIIPVDLYGQCADYGSIRPICERHGVPIVEDAAEALGATCGGQAGGSLGEMGVLSFNGNKIITTSGGGMLLSENRDWIEQARFLATQARDPAPHYQHSQVGYNYRMSNLLAAVGRGQLGCLPDRVVARRRNNALYREALESQPGISFMPEASYGRSNCWLTCILVEPEAFGASREDIRLRLEEHNIEARPVWKPMHLQPVYARYRCRGGAVAGALFENGLCLPSGSNLTDEDRQRIVDLIVSTPRRGAG